MLVCEVDDCSFTNAAAAVSEVSSSLISTISANDENNINFLCTYTTGIAVLRGH